MKWPEKLKALPIFPHLGSVTEALSVSDILLEAAPGVGKTTLVPLALLNAPFVSKKIIMLEPRRLAARAACTVMSKYLGEEPGGTVGYRTKLDTKVSKATRIEIVTDGVFTRIIQNDPELKDYSVVIFDEFHERSLQNDLGFVLTLEVQENLRPDLRLLLMSATPDPGFLERCDNFKALSIPGKMYPVEISYLPPDYGEKMEEAISRAVKRLLNVAEGDVLVFLPGVAEIENTKKLLGELNNVSVLTLHGMLSKEEQDLVLFPGEKRRVILSSAIAESSLTVPGVRNVVDSGLSRYSVYDPVSAFERLETHASDLGTITQRTGRAGRIGPGRVIRLWEKGTENLRPDSAEPEIVHADLSAVSLSLAVWGEKNYESLKWPVVPKKGTMLQARELLISLGALDKEGRVTEKGQRMEELPLHPRLASMTLRAREEGALRKAARLASLLESGDGVRGDLEAKLKGRIPQLAERSSERLIRLLNADGEDRRDISAGRLISWAFPDRIAARRESGSFLLQNGKGGVLTFEGGLSSCDYIAVASLEGKSGNAKIFSAAELTLDDITEDFAAFFSVQEKTVWEDKRKKALTVRETKLGEITLKREEKNLGSEEESALLLEKLLEEELRPLKWTSAAKSFMERAECAHAKLGLDWPSFDREELEKDAKNWLLPFFKGLSSFTQAGEIDLLPALKGRLGGAKSREIEKLFPLTYQLPSGRSAKIDYTDTMNPTLSSYLQDFYGMDYNPTIAGGRITLRIELLNPAGRPVQVTSDLANFWKTSYPMIRKELKGRYPKHNWPEEPMLGDKRLKSAKKVL
ncbi:ATP-dependent helicase HrpB [bacterium]|nr:ATP-dependent helicase HrpB [bacterium]